MRGRPAITISAEARTQAVASLKRYVAENLDDEIGDLKADLLLGFILEELGPTIYNQAIADARTFIEERAADLDAIAYQVEFPHWTTR